MNGKQEFYASGGPITAVLSWHATDEHRAHALSRHDAQGVVAQLTGEPSHETLKALEALTAGVAPSLATHAPPSVLFAAVTSAVDAGQLLLVEGWDFAGGSQRGAGHGAEETNPVATLARRIMGTRGELAFEGRRYRIVGSRVSSRASVGQGYRQVGQIEARALFKRMAERLPVTPDDKRQWAALLALVADTRNAGGVVLMRFVPRGAINTKTSTTAATTPSQLREQIAPEDWIEVQIAYDDGTPFDGSCAVELPDGRIIQGAPGADGLIRFDGLTPGTCKVRFPDVDASAVKPA